MAPSMKKTVSFQAEVRIILPFEERNDHHEQYDKWITHDQLKQILCSVKATLKELERVGGNETLLDENLHCIRGLESIIVSKHGRSQPQFEGATGTSRSTTLQTRTKNDYVRSLLFVQDEQRQAMGVEDPRGLCSFSKWQSKQTKQEALLKAAKDAQDVTNISDGVMASVGANHQSSACHNKTTQEEQLLVSEAARAA